MAAGSLAEIQAQAAAILTTLDTSYEPGRAAARYNRFHQAAAVLATFDPKTLRPAPGPGDASPRDLAALLADSEVVPGGSSERHALPTPVRREVLQQLQTPAAMQAALAANPDGPDDPLQAMFAAYLRGAAPPPEQQSERQLTASYQCLQWIEGILPDLPTLGAVQGRWNLLDLLRPLNTLAGTNFRGRTAELGWLHGYVFAGDLGSRPAGSLVIHGPGGVGKSALLARFILDNAGGDPGQRVPWAYVDFDRPGLNVAEPLTLLVELVRQLAIQYPQYQDYIERFRRSLQETQATRSLRRQEAQRAAAAKTAVRRQPESEWERAFKNLYSLLVSLGVAERPLLLVLDTFEEVQYRSSAGVAELLRFLGAFQHTVPSLRPVLAGRNPVYPTAGGPYTQVLMQVPSAPPQGRVTRSLPSTYTVEYRVENRELGDFQPDAAQELMVDRGIPPDLARTIVRQVGGNPLSLRLAVDLWQRGLTSAEGITGLAADGLLEFQIQEGQIQGQLYARILEHIHDPEIRPLAFPGLVLRRLTPDLILRVLARTCRVKVRDLDHAADLLARLAEEQALVVLVDSGVLIHRSDVRRIMVHLLRQKEPEKAHKIEQAAVRYYAQRASPAERAEEIYHRLTLNQPLPTIEKRWADAEQRGWIPEMRPLLAAARDELEPRPRAWLAARLDLELTPEESAEADQQSWEHAVAKRARSGLEQGRAEEALADMEQRPAWLPGSPLYLLATQAWEQLGNPDKAREVLAQGIRSAARKGDRLLAIDMRLHGARLDSQLGDLGAARRKLDEAEQLVRGGDGSALRLLEIDLYRHLAARVAGDETAQAAAAEAIAHRFDGLSDARLGSDPAFGAWLAAELGPAGPALLARVLRIGGLALPEPDEPRSDLTQQLVRALATWEVESSAAAGERPGLLARAAGAEPKTDDTPSQVWRTYLYQLKPRERGRRLAQVLQAHTPIPAAVLQALADLLRLRAGDRAGWYPLAVDAPVPAAGVVEPAFAAVDVAVGDVSVEATVKSIGGAPSLSGDQMRQCTNALLDAFPTQDEFAEMLRVRLGRNLETLSFSDSIVHSVPQVVQAANREGWLLSLIDAARSANPGNPALVALADQMGIGSLGVSQAAATEDSLAFQLGEAGVLDVAAWRAGLAEIENRVCRIEIGGRLVGTGFLLGPDVVLTAYHVLADVVAGDIPPVDVALRFDYKQGPDGAVVNEGSLFQLDREWLVEVDRDRLGYALLRAAGQPGYSGIGSVALESYAALRRWIDLPTAPVDWQLDMALIILGYHPRGHQRLTITAKALLEVDAGATRIRYRIDADPESSGAPCFDRSWNLVALHLGSEDSAGRGREDGYGYGTPIAAIATQLRDHGYGNLLGGYDL